MRVAAAFFLVALTGCASVAPQASPAHIWFGASAVTDIASSQAAFDRGATEQNPFMGSNPSTLKMAAFKGAGFAGMRAIENAIEEQVGRQLTGWEQFWLYFIPNAVQTWAGFHNHGVAR